MKRKWSCLLALGAICLILPNCGTWHGADDNASPSSYDGFDDSSHYGASIHDTDADRHHDHHRDHGGHDHSSSKGSKHDDHDHSSASGDGHRDSGKNDSDKSDSSSSKSDDGDKGSSRSNR